MASPEQQIVQLNVAAAASLVDTMHELEEIYYVVDPNVNINFTFASSWALANEIESGKPCDLFISATNFPMDELQQKGLIAANSCKNLLSNTLVLIAPPNSTLSGFEGLTDASIKKIAIADPDNIPVGYYAKQTLISMGLWEKLQPKLIFEDGISTNAGFAFKSDTYQAPDIKIVETAPPDSHDPIVYPMAIVNTGASQTEAQNFADFLTTDQASEVFAKYYFVPLSPLSMNVTPGEVDSVQLNIAAATNMVDEKQELEGLHYANGANVNMNFTFAPSGSLVGEIANGKPYDRSIPEANPPRLEPCTILPQVVDRGAGDSDIGVRLDKIEAMLVQLVASDATVNSTVEKKAIDMQESQANEKILKHTKSERTASMQRLPNKSRKKNKGTKKHR